VDAPGGVCPPPGGLEAATPVGMCPSSGDFASVDWCYACYDVCDLQGL